ncbi:hypothetical protein FRC06_009760, partial [Ceratobasidium sp. 370]
MNSAMDVDTVSEGSQPHAQNPSERFLPAKPDPAEFNQKVLRAIQERRAVNPRDFSRTRLRLKEPILLLRIIVRSYLGCDMDDQACDDYLYDNEAFTQSLEDAYASHSFADLLDDLQLPPEVVESARKTAANNLNQIPRSNSGRSLLAFETKYIGETHKVLIEALNAERGSYPSSAAARPYNFAVSVIQSSGMGKSRMVEEAGNIVFTLPTNLREDLPPNIKGKLLVFPVTTIMLTDRKSRTDEQQQADYAVLLRVLFEHATKIVEAEFRGCTGADLALKFANHMKKGRDDTTVGTNRQRFLDDVAREAAELRAGREMNQTLDSLAASLQASCGRLIDVVHPTRPADTNACFVYFDEAHPLTTFAKTPVPTAANEPSSQGSTSNPNPDKSLTKAAGALEKPHSAIQPIRSSDQNPKRAPYHNLGRVLSQLVDYSIFFIFLSTNSHLESFAPTPANRPSARDVDGSQLIPPFTELPFDVFEDTTGPLTLANLCKIEAMVKSGRAMWQAQYRVDPRKNIINFATDKLTSSGVLEHEFDSALACLGVRIGITFDAINPAAHATQSRLVETHMRVVYSIPRHREYMHTGSPSEPILAEAAARHLNPINQRSQISQLGPMNLAIACQKGFLARGERGELYGRLL